jgi:transcriptional regulator with XRE-family HTH domain
MNNLGKTIQQVRNSKAISQKELSEMTNLTQATISKIENGSIKIDVETLEKIALALQTSSLKMLYLTALQTNDISSEKKVVLEKMRPYIEKINMSLVK